MSDDLFKDCDCGDCGDCDCGDCFDCDCDCDCFDCDCNCDDCLPGNNFIIICCCFPPPVNNDDNRTNRADAPPNCCCCCWERRHPRRRGRENKRKKKGFCCWRLWCCFARKEPSPPPSPPRLGPDELPPRGYMRDGRYPMPEDLDSHMNDRWDRHHELDMPPRGYMSGGRYPRPGEMRMYRDEYYGRGDKWNEPTRKDYRSGGIYGIREVERDARSKDYYYRRDGRDESEARGTASRDHKDERKKPVMDKLEVSSTDYREYGRLAKKEDLGKAAEDERKDADNTRSMVQGVPSAFYHGRDLRQDKPDELEIAPYDDAKFDKFSSHGDLDSPTHHGQGARASGSEQPQGDYPRRHKPDDDKDTPDQGCGFQGMWSAPLKY